MCYVISCDNVRVQSATGWTVSVHILHMPRPVITFVFKVLRNRLLWYMFKPVLITFVFKMLRNGRLNVTKYVTQYVFM